MSLLFAAVAAAIVVGLLCWAICIVNKMPSSVGGYSTYDSRSADDAILICSIATIAAVSASI